MDVLLRTALRARDGDRVALEAFLRLIQADVWRACRYTVDAQSADDLAQEVMVRVVGSLHRITPDHQVRSWVLGIARHVCLDEIRRRQRRRRMQSEVVNGRPVTTSEVHSELGIRDLVERLDPDRREAFVLTQIIGMSYEESAEICECPVGTIRSRVARARLELRNMLEEFSAETRGTLPPPRATGSM